ncbi:MAG: PhoH family protein [Deltaproteobacteria bacterium]|nr:PhoH family protein [Deltaproteobacteria bacterium]
MSRKNFVLDTNVLLHDPRAIHYFADNHVIIPIYVIEEIDSFKKELSERGRNAREIARQLDSFRQLGRLSEGVPIAKGGWLRVALGHRALPDPLRRAQVADNYILAVALEVRDSEPAVQTILVTKDVNLRIRGDALGLTTADYNAEKIDIQELYSGAGELSVSGAEVDAFYQEGSLAASSDSLYPNQFILLRDRDNPNHTALGRYDAEKKLMVPVRKLREGTWGIRPRNKEQHFAIDLLLNDDIKLVSLVGKAGTGKTLLAIAAGLQKVVEENIYHKLLVSRPIFPLGRDIGYLPGDIEEKLNPWMQPIYDNVELLLGFNKNDKKDGRSYTELIDLGYVQIEPLTYIRGRSIPNQFMIVDEAQNLTPHEIKTIITRAGDGTKIVLTGDPYQIDNPYVDASSNGITTVVERFKNEPLAGTVTFTKGERSALAELASNVL